MKTAGLGTGALTTWLYSVAAAAYGLPPIPAEIAVILGGTLYELVQMIIRRQRLED